MSQAALTVGFDRRSSGVPVILAHPALGQRPNSQSVVAKARLKYRNQCCPRCRRATVEPVELDDSLFDRNGAAIPGTASVVGFTCGSCRGEWSTSHLRLAAHGG